MLTANLASTDARQCNVEQFGFAERFVVSKSMSLGDFEMNYAEYIDGTQTADDLAAMERCRPYIHEFEAQRENGPAGVLRQAEIVRAALTDLSEDFFVFTHAVGLSTFHSLHVVQLGERIRKLRQLLGGKLEFSRTASLDPSRPAFV